MAKKTPPIHPKVKSMLGYEESMPDKEFLTDWKKRATQVCKPCWELKYCPYGPFVEQSPLLPATRAGAIEHIEYLKNCLSTGQMGTISELDEDRKEFYKKLLEEAEEDSSILCKKVARKLYFREMFEQVEKEGRDPMEALLPPLSDFEKYKVPFPLEGEENAETQIDITPEIEAGVQEEITRMEIAIDSGKDDNRTPLDAARRKMFQAEVDSFVPDEYPEFIPEVVADMSCNEFGHVCPVVFVGESITETTENRRKGRYISFHIKMRIVRRDNYTCQECGKHLLDYEVEFDHIIPDSKGGSGEEHNIRLTCFDCNRGKSNSVVI